MPRFALDFPLGFARDFARVALLVRRLSAAVLLVLRFFALLVRRVVFWGIGDSEGLRPGPALA